jgi:hypothetical protein
LMRRWQRLGGSFAGSIFIAFAIETCKGSSPELRGRDAA